MNRNEAMLGTAFLFLALALYNGMTVFSHVSLASKIGFFVFGFGSGLTFGIWLAQRLGRK
jgi:hypothetical protein